MRKVLDDRGFIKPFISMVVLVGVIFVGIQFGTPYYRYNTFQSHVKSAIEYEGGRIQVPALRTQIMKEAEDIGVPLTEDRLNVTINEAKMIKVHATWSETVNFWDYYQKRLDFTMDLEY